MISYIEGHEVTPAELKKALRRATLAGTITPVLCGSALRNKRRAADAGRRHRLPAVPEDVPLVVGINPRRADERSARAGQRAVIALVFKTLPTFTSVACVRARVLRSRAASSAVLNTSRDERSASAGRCACTPASEDVDEVFAGDIGGAAGNANTFTGDTLSDPSRPLMLERSVPEPVISVAIGENHRRPT